MRYRSFSGDARRASLNLEAEYAMCIIGEPGALKMTAESRKTFAETMRRNLVLKIAGSTSGTARLAACCGK